jgi:hypothetical protein
MLGWHVHEKAVLMMLLPMMYPSSSLFCDLDKKSVFALNLTANLSLIPLVMSWPGDGHTEQLFIVTYSVLMTVVHCSILREELSRTEKWYFGGFVPVLVTYYLLRIIRPGLFLPLMLISVRPIYRRIPLWE